MLSGRDGRQWFNDQPEAVIALNRAKERDIVFDYEHATQLKASKGEPAPALGLSPDVSDAAAVSAINNLKDKHPLALNAEQQLSSQLDSKTPDLTQFIAIENHPLALNRAAAAEGTLALVQTEQLNTRAGALLDKTINHDRVVIPESREQYLAMCHDEQCLASVEALFKTLTPVLAPATNLDDKKPGAAALALNRG